jgi:hypothetical protein
MFRQSKPVLTSVNLPLTPSLLKEKVARMSGQQFKFIHHFPLNLTLSFKERELFAALAEDWR